MKITCIRHTHVAVPHGICYGQLDVPLAGTYEAERESISKKLAKTLNPVVYSSPATRCKKLAADLFVEENIRFDDRLLEFHFGDWEGLRWDEIYATREGKKWMNDYLGTPCLNGESYSGFQQRIATFLIDLKKSGHTNVFLVTHAGVIRIIKSLLEEKQMKEVFSTFNPSYGGIFSFEMKKYWEPRTEIVSENDPFFTYPSSK